MYTIVGGKLTPALDISIHGELPVSDETCFANARHSAGLGLKTYRSWQMTSPHLAVIGGGPSINDHLEELRNWDGDIWAINGAWNWCRDRGVKATFFACDPHPIVLQWAAGVDRAILECSCDPRVFELLKDADVYTFDADVENGGIVGHASTATAAPHMAARMGYRSVTFFGCESSYLPNASHAYMDEDRKEQMIVRCNKTEFLTAPDLFLQALGLSKFIRELPEFLANASGGLLGAMVADPAFHVLWVSQPLADSLAPIERGVSGAMAMADNLEAFGLSEAAA